MRACKKCGLSLGQLATFCPVCGTLADPEPVSLPITPEPIPPAPETPASEPEAPTPEPEPPAAHTPAELEAEARECDKTDPARAVALYRRAVVAHLEASDDPLADRSATRDVQRLFDRLSIALKREGLLDEALEEIETAAYLGLVDDPTRGTKAQREALAKRRDALRKAGAKPASGA